VALIVFFGLASSLHLVRSGYVEARAAGPGSDPMTLFGTRLDPMRRDLPSSGIVGYVTDTSNDLQNNPDREFIWTRYYLAPLLVTVGSHWHYVVGNFHNPVPSKLLSDSHLVLVRNYGNGMLLFVNSDQ